MIFSEIYSTYYQIVATVLNEALQCRAARPIADLVQDAVSVASAKESADESAPCENRAWAIREPLQNRSWPFFRGNGAAVGARDVAVRQVPSMPLTFLQKRWLKAIAADPRIQLFPETLPDFPDVEPLFKPGDVRVFDAYNDGDPYTDENYIRNFRTLLNAVKCGTRLVIDTKNRKGGECSFIGVPRYLEYSEKDDKFRVQIMGSEFDEGKRASVNDAACGEGKRAPANGAAFGETKRACAITLNLGRIISVREASEAECEKAAHAINPMAAENAHAITESDPALDWDRIMSDPTIDWFSIWALLKEKPGNVKLEIIDERNAPERVLMHFSHFAKTTRRKDETHYELIVHYEADDEAELIIRVLSFGPSVKVIDPPSFREKIIEKLSRQKELDDSIATKQFNENSTKERRII